MALLTGFDEINTANDTFSDWLSKTNAMIVLMRNDVVTANSSIANTQGDAQILGYLSANVLAANTMRGGDLTGGSANLDFSSNTTFSANSTFGNNVFVYVSETLTAEVGIMPNANGAAAGNTTKRWDTYATDIDISGNADVAGELVVLGNTTSEAFSANILSVGYITGVAGALNINSNTTFDQAMTVTGAINALDNLVVALDITANNLTAQTGITTPLITSSGELSITPNTTFSSAVVVEGDLTVNGTFHYALTEFDNLLPAVTGNDLGNTTHRWDGSLSNTSVSGYLHPTANGIACGNTTKRWNMFTTDIDASGDATITGLVQSANLVVTGTANIGTLEVSSLTTDRVAIIGNTANVTSNSGVVIDSFPATETPGFKYVVYANTASEDSVYMLEIICTHSYGANTPYMHFSRYGEIKNDADITLVPDLNGANVELTATCPSAEVANTHTFKIFRMEVR
jgi:hypothetical protein